MEINESILEALITKTENLTKLSGELFNHQHEKLAQMQVMVDFVQNKLAQELLNLASEMNKNKLKLHANRIESHVVQYLLEAPYNTKKAFSIHQDIFSERHKMAMFLHENLTEIKRNIKTKINNTHIPSKKIKVFTYWHSSRNLPPIVSLCRKSLQKYIEKDKFDLIILNENNYTNWTDFRKSDIKTNLTQAHFTDILRLKLLEQWGGFWLDATCLLTQDFYQATEHIRAQEQFLFVYDTSRTGTWFIYSNPQNKIIPMISKAISLWWSKECYLTNYFMLHDIIEMFYWVDSGYHKSWNKMLKTSPENALALLKNYNQTVLKEDFDKFLCGSFIHKLTYKYKADQIVKNSPLEYLLKLKQR